MALHQALVGQERHLVLAEVQSLMLAVVVVEVMIMAQQALVVLAVVVLAVVEEGELLELPI
tara:strand:- start:601 stop:783 length:183 start_codon:yes stop_codon:yes gene_type:complete